MTINFEVRRAEPADAPDMARVHVDTWRETYRGLISDSVLDDPTLLDWRKRFWIAALTDPTYEQNTIAVASHEGAPIGIAMSGPSLDDANEPQQLYLLYAYAAFHGSGVGTALLNAVINPTTPASLWVADPNPRAQAFYRKKWVCCRWCGEDRKRRARYSNGPCHPSCKRPLMHPAPDTLAAAICPAGDIANTIAE